MSTPSHKFWFGRNTGETGSTQRMSINGSRDPDKDINDLDALVSLMHSDSMEEPPPNITQKVISMFRTRTFAHSS